MSRIDQPCRIPTAEGQVLIVTNVLLAIIGTCGNFLTILAVLKTPQLRRKPSNFLLLSLSVADVLVTTICQPVFVAILYLKSFHGQCHNLLELLYIIVVSLSGFSSNSHLATISIDRVISVVKPHHHHNIMKRWLKIILSVCWGLAVLFTIFNSLFFKQARIAVVVIFFVCFLIMIISYAIILYKIQGTQDANSFSARYRMMERRVSATIAIVIVLYIVCWLPLVVYTQLKPNALLYAGVRTLYLANSSMNFVVYSLRIRAFRVAYVRIIKTHMPGIPQIFCCRNINDEVNESQGTELEMSQTTRGTRADN